MKNLTNEVPIATHTSPSGSVLAMIMFKHKPTRNCACIIDDTNTAGYLVEASTKLLAGEQLEADHPRECVSEYIPYSDGWWEIDE